MSWNFDPLTAIFTLVVAPVFLLLLKITARHIKGWSSFALEGLMYWAGSSIRKSLAAALSLKRYARLVLSGPSKELYVPASTDVALQIDEIYVPLMLQHQGTAKDSFTHSSVLEVGNRLRVIGDPGSGKSSFVKRLLRDACRSALKKPAAARLPVWYELKNLRVPQSGGDAGDWFFTVLRDQVAHTGVYGMAECFDAYATTNGLLVLLDGLDEVTTADYELAERAILALSTHLHAVGPGNVIILTSRIQFHQQIRDAYRDSFPNVLTLRPFTPTDIYEFLGRWPFHQGRAKAATKIFSELADRPSLRELCSNPLILSMYVADAEARGTFIAPDSRTEFYSKVSEELLIRRRLKQTGPTLAPTVVRQQRERVLGALAYDHLLDPHESANSLDYARAMSVIAEVHGCPLSDAPTVFNEIAKETGLVSEERRGQTFRFIHLTFCEYFAAVEAVQGRVDGWTTLVATHRLFQKRRDRQYAARLLEVLPFAAQLLPRVQHAIAIENIASLDDARLLARVFFETKMYRRVEWQEFVSRQEKHLLKVPEKHWDEQWLADLHLLQVVMRDAEQSLAVMGRGDAESSALDSFFEKLVKKQRRSLARLLSAYAERDAAAVFRVAELCHIDLAHDYADVIIRHVDQMPFLAIVREAAAVDVGRSVLWATILAEAAMRSAVVRYALVSGPSLEGFAAIAEQSPKSARWWAAGVTSRTAVTESLTVALTKRPGAEFPILALLADFPAPGRFRRSAAWIFAAVPLAFVTAAWPELSRTLVSMVGRIGLVGLSILLLMPLYLMMLRGAALRIVYRRLLERDAFAVHPNAEMAPMLFSRSTRGLFGTFLPRSLRMGLKRLAAASNVPAWSRGADGASDGDA